MNAQSAIDLLKDRGVMHEAQAEDVLLEMRQSERGVLEVMAELGIVEPAGFYQHVAQSLHTEYVDLNQIPEPTPELLARIPAGMARLYGALPVNITEEGLHVVLTDPLNPQVSEDLRFALGKEIVVTVAPVDQVEERIKQYYGMDSEGMGEVLANLGEGERPGEELGNLEEEANAAPIIRFVDLVLDQAIAAHASDIHFEPFESEFKIRYRVDGALYEMAPPPLHLSLPIISRVKVMANLNIAERRLPQDGRIVKEIGDRQVDLRVSTLPTVYGESVVLRVLDRSAVNLDLEALGMPKYIYEYIGSTVEKPNGIFIVTGPTGAGKTTTLYAALRRINRPEKKILTAEDPVEYDIEGIQQIPANETIGLTFARILRSFLRQDPDVIMVGEMRDLETAQIAIQASLTGHLVLSTLHTNDASGAVTRLIDMGAEPFLIAASLEAVLAQRLLRTICSHCSSRYEPSEKILQQLGLTPEDLGAHQFYHGAGCEQCNFTGYHGRKGIYELLDISDPIRELIGERAPTVKIRQKAIELGMSTLREDGLDNIYSGATTVEEVLKYT